MASPRALGGAAVASPPLPSFASRRRRAARRARVASASSSSSSSSSSTLDVFVEIQMPDGSVPPRLTFALRPDLCPKSVENFATLLSGANAGVDPALTYRGCAFEPFGGKYSHVCKGRGKTIFGPGKFVEREAMSATRNGTPGAGGGTYYGERVDLDDDDDRVTVLAVPTSGPGFGGSRFAIMRVGDSPGSLRQRLLTNMMVLGTLTGGLETLEAMVGADGPCVITDGGAL